MGARAVSGSVAPERKKCAELVAAAMTQAVAQAMTSAMAARSAGTNHNLTIRFSARKWKRA